MADSEELLRLNQRLLDAITDSDWAVYEELCDPTLTAFEPEAKGQLVEGLEFHSFYFNRKRPKGDYQTTMCSPKVRIMDDVAVIGQERFFFVKHLNRSLHIFINRLIGAAPNITFY